jgi:maltose alpha-D-glucosyltransferase/alpha-amylase
VDAPEVLAIRYDFRRTSMLTLHNFSGRRQTVAVDPRCDGGGTLINVFDSKHSRCDDGSHSIVLEPYGHRWYRVGASDNALNRTAF